MCPLFIYSVVWWNSLHQGPRLLNWANRPWPAACCGPCCPMLLGFMLFFGAVLCMRLQGEVLNRERQATWVREAVQS
jgi:heme exporter protein C